VNRSELVSQVAERAGLTKREAERAVAAVVEAVGEALRSGSEVRLAGLGIFEVVQRAAKVGRNIRTGQRIEVPARRVVRFRAAKPLRDAVA
jgi:DNA-binding protein HU-beta